PGAPPPTDGKHVWQWRAAAFWQWRAALTRLGGARADFSPRSIWLAALEQVGSVHAHCHQWCSDRAPLFALRPTVAARPYWGWYGTALDICLATGQSQSAAQFAARAYCCGPRRSATLFQVVNYVLCPSITAQPPCSGARCLRHSPLCHRSPALLDSSPGASWRGSRCRRTWAHWTVCGAIAGRADSA